MYSTAAKLAPSKKEVVQPASTFAARDKQRVVLSLALVALSLVFYNPIVHDGFVLLDDVPYILSNPQVRAGLTWNTIKWSFTTFHAGYWHPLTWLSHALDCQLFGVNPAGHHYVSLLFHAANAVLLFLLLEEATTLLWPSLLVAALFAVHPINVESVAWAAERKNVLSMFFFLLALWAYGRYARRESVGRYSVVALFFVLGLMAKPQIITLPCVLLLWDYWPLERMFAKSRPDDSGLPRARSLGFLVAEKIPLFVIVVGASIITVLGQRSSDAVRTLSEFSLTARVQNAIVSYGLYLRDLVCPRHLAPLYPHPGNSSPISEVAGCAFLLAALTAVVLLRRDRRYLAVGWLWFVGVLVPMIGIVQVGEQSRADRFLYIPMIGFAITVVWSLWDIAKAQKFPLVWAAVPSMAAVVLLGALTYHQLGYWKNGETLWRYVLSVTDKNYMAHQSLAMVLDQQGRVEEAIVHFRAAESLHVFPRQQVLNLGIYEQRNGHVQDAIELYQKVLRTSNEPGLQAMAWDQIASADVQIKNYDQARESYEKALHIRPDDAASWMGSGLLAERGGELQPAVVALTRSVQVEATDVGFLILADALRRDSRFQEAQQAEDMARKISRDFSQAQQSAGETLKFFDVSSQVSSLQH
ncbi:MAG: tetratricopeptide repeat protein [Candidatus Sulfotelmatobacter sp.]